MNICTVISFCLLSLSLFLLTPKTLAYSVQKTIYVPTDYATIQEAINHASLGDTIFVYNGSYHEHVTIDRSVSLVGQDMTTTIIDGDNTGTAVTIIQSNVNLTGFTLQHSGSTYWGITLGSGASYNSITRNIVRNNSAGVQINQFANNNSIIQNDLIDNQVYGVRLNSQSSSNLVSENNVSRTEFEGISIDESSDNVISKNSIVSNAKGIILYDDTTDNRIFENNIKSNGVGIVIEPPGGNVIYNNSFVDNSEQASISNYVNKGCVNTWDDGSRGNYWSDYTGVDSNGDGIGDTPYTIDKSDISKNQDRYPVVKGFFGGGLYWVPYLIVAVIAVIGSIIVGFLVRRRKRRAPNPLQGAHTPPPPTELSSCQEM
jgi:parallel beta-helix repeat protein